MELENLLNGTRFFIINNPYKHSLEKFSQKLKYKEKYIVFDLDEIYERLAAEWYFCSGQRNRYLK